MTLKTEEDSIIKIAQITRNKKLDIVFVTPIPKWERLNPVVNEICINGSDTQWYRPKGTITCSTYSEIDRNVYEKKESHILNFLKNIETTYPNFHVFPIHEFLCNSSKCPSHIDGIRLYRDNAGHISLFAAKQYISSPIRSFLLQRELLIEKSIP